LSDRIGHWKILIPAILMFSLMSGLSGMAQGLMGLILIRALMGAMEGTYCPTSFTAVASASKPARRGFNQGLQQSCFALFGLALGPIVAPQLLGIVPSWRWVFWVVAIPGFVVGLLLFFVLREPAETQGGQLIGAGAAGGRWLEVLRVPNIIVCRIDRCRPRHRGVPVPERDSAAGARYRRAGPGCIARCIAITAST
jgi:MFS family permease